MGFGDILAGLASAHHEREQNDLAFARHQREKKMNIFADLAQNPNYAPEQQEWFLQASLAQLDPKKAKQFDIRNGKVAIPVDRLQNFKPAESQVDRELPEGAAPSIPKLTMRQPIPLDGLGGGPSALPGGIAPQAPVLQAPEGMFSQSALLQAPTPPPPEWTSVAKPIRRPVVETPEQKDAREIEKARKIGGIEVANAKDLAKFKANLDKKDPARRTQIANLGRHSFLIDLDTGETIQKYDFEERPEEEKTQIVDLGKTKVLVKSANGEIISSFDVDGTQSGRKPAVREITENGKVFYEYFDENEPEKLGKRVFKENVKPAQTGGATKPRGVTSGDANRIADYDGSLDDLGVLRVEIGDKKNSTGAFPKLGAMLPDAVTDITGWGTEAKQRQAIIDRVKQVIGKALEGGVLRKEDETKYDKILPKIGDTAAVVKSKIDGLEVAIKQRRSILIDSLEDAGYDTSKYPKTGATNSNAGWSVRVKP